MRVAHRGPSDRLAESRIRGVLATVLGLPIIALVIGQSVGRRFGLGRPTFLTLGLLATSMAVSVVSTAPIDARSAARIMDRETRQVPLADLGVDRTKPIEQPDTRSVGPIDRRVDVAPAHRAPRVVRFRPRDGWTRVSRFAAVSVRFTRPMDHASTEAAFRAVVGGRRIVGTFRWAEGDTVLVLTPASPLPHGARVELSVASGARAEDGAGLATARRVSFTVQRRAAASPQPTRPPDTQDRPRRASAWRWPLLGPITQRFGESLTQYGYHYGIDIDGATGDAVRAARRGRVVVAGSYDQCGGLQVHVDHGDGLVSWYRHLSRIHVKEGTIVDAGTIIGRVGNTGCSLGSHLHFAIRLGSRFVDPLDYLPLR